jgi:hypothetical protein
VNVLSILCNLEPGSSGISYHELTSNSTTGAELETRSLEKITGAFRHATTGQFLSLLRHSRTKRPLAVIFLVAAVPFSFETTCVPRGIPQYRTPYSLFCAVPSVHIWIHKAVSFVRLTHQRASAIIITNMLEVCLLYGAGCSRLSQKT